MRSMRAIAAIALATVAVAAAIVFAAPSQTVAESTTAPLPQLDLAGVDASLDQGATDDAKENASASTVSSSWAPARLASWASTPAR